uniref:Uncharacterized protein n=1 Tax=Arundo donax TaxID=35708 RepID=A0A0A9T1R7_ARUDO
MAQPPCFVFSSPEKLVHFRNLL